MTHLAGKRLLTQNSELRPHGIWNWTIPAWIVTLNDGSRLNCCPNAGPCARVCYARFGTYRFRNVLSRHVANVEYVLDDPDGWAARMTDELAARRFRPTGTPRDLDHDPDDRTIADWVAAGGRAVRVHDAGDFFASWYLNLWSGIAASAPDVLFYAYTKEVEMVKAASLPANFRIVLSYGGQQDELIDRDRDRHADVFPSALELAAAGYYDQEENDLLAVTAPTNRIGIVANNLPVAIRRFSGRTMSGLVERRSD